MSHAEVADMCQQWLAYLRNREKGTASCHHAKKFLACFNMENRRNAARIEQIDQFLREQGIVLSHKGEVRESLWGFGHDDALTLRLADKYAAFRQLGKTQVAFAHAGTIDVMPANSNLRLYPHQEEAVAALNKQVKQAGNAPFAGLLVLPTGGGKTLTAAYWLAKNLLDKRRKILWIAHRHELLEQAKNTFHERLAYHDVLPRRRAFSYRLLSGIHDKPVNIQPTDDLLIASKDSLNAGFAHLRERWLQANDELFLVIDEAHHATARTYRKLLESLRGSVRQLHLLGLTATSFRTVQEESGLLAKVFTSDIIYKVDLRTLIHRGILAKPIFEPVATDVDLGKLLTEEDLAKINYFDITSIGKETARSIAENSERNWSIVRRYLKHRQRYGQTLVFALDRDNAIALKKLFTEAGVRCDFVLSAIRDAGTGVTVSSQQNKVVIERFRQGELEVLINVNILTEGTDLPRVQTVFLARPTISPILMTQMVGRGLRGEKAGGTAEAYIVSFVDNWHDKVAWVNPEKLLIEENTDFNDQQRTTQKQVVRLISISKIEEFALLTSANLDETAREQLENLPFSKRLPLGIYHFSLLVPHEGEAREKNCEILVYSNMQPAYEALLRALPQLLARPRLSAGDYLPEAELDELAAEVEASCFQEYDPYPAHQPQDVRDVLQYYYQREALPVFVPLEQRERFDIGRVAAHIVASNLTRQQEQQYRTQLWHDHQAEWQVFFGRNERYFLHELDLAINQLLNPELYARPAGLPTDSKELRRLEQLSMADIRKHNSAYWRYLHDQVFAKHRDAEGYYVSSSGDYRSQEKRFFQLDHIKPISKGGLTTLDNLQLLTRRENGLKGDN